MPAFDVAGARKAGYDDKEILSYVAGEENPDLIPGTDAEKIRLLLARNGKHMLDVEYLSPTQLEPMQEVQFQDWAKRNKVRLEPGWNEDYDMRGLWKANPGAAPDPQGQWPDTYKLPNHPTFSSQSIYALPELPAPKLPQGLSGPPASVPGSVPQTGERRNLTPQEQDALWSEQGIQPTLLPTSLLDMAMLATSGPEQDTGIPLSMLAAVRNPADKKASLLNMVRGSELPEDRWFHGTKGTFEELDPEFAHPGSEHGKATYLTNREKEAAKYGGVRSVEFAGQVFPEESPVDFKLINKVTRQLVANHPDKAAAIASAVATAKGTGAKTNDIVLQEIRRALPGDFVGQQTAINNALKNLGYAARSYTEDSGARTLAVFDKAALKSRK